jgi:hypothetical protein
VLNLVNSAANVIAIIAAALVLISVAFIYFTGAELTGRAKEKHQTPGEDRTKALRLSKVEAELAAARRSEETKALWLSQTAAELVAAQRSDEAKTLRLSKAEAELAVARRSEEEAKALAKQMEEKQGPRTITPEQRSQFLKAVHGLPTGRVIVSAFFDNKETHDFGAEILSLLKDAGFDVIERAPLNFFTTSRPSSGIRIGSQNITDPPPHFLTVRKGFRAMGLDTPTTNLVNAQEDDVVEIQVTPKQ